MKWLMAVLALGATGCGAPQMCDSVQVGQVAAGLPMTKLTSTNPFGLSGIMSRNAYPGSFSKGPAAQHLCCFSQALGDAYDWCTTEELQCSEAAFQGVDVTYLEEPFSDQSRAPDDADFCFAAVKDGIVVAVWLRTWS